MNDQEFLIYWHTTDNLFLHYISTTTHLQSARDFCMSKHEPGIVHLIYRLEEHREGIVARYHMGEPYFLPVDATKR